MRHTKFISIFLLILTFGCDGCVSPDDNVDSENEKETEVGFTSEDFENMDSNFPSFVSIDNTTPENMEWIKVDELSDEFDTWDDSKWYNSYWNYGNTPVWMTDENSGVADGNMYIQATLREGEVNWFQTARVHSIAKISYPMYTECRMRTAHISAFNTFWLNNGDINDRDEIDIVENNSNPTDSCMAMPGLVADFPWATDLFPKQMNSQYFLADDGVTERHESNYNTDWLSDENPKKGTTWNETYHIVGAWWMDNRTVQFYLDGEPAGKITTQSDFTRELEIIWDLWTSSECNIGGLPAKEDLLNDSINTMYVDWVRTWKLEEK